MVAAGLALAPLARLLGPNAASATPPQPTGDPMAWAIKAFLADLPAPLHRELRRSAETGRFRRGAARLARWLCAHGADAAAMLSALERARAADCRGLRMVLVGGWVVTAAEGAAAALQRRDP